MTVDCIAARLEVLGNPTRLAVYRLMPLAMVLMRLTPARS